MRFWKTQTRDGGELIPIVIVDHRQKMARVIQARLDREDTEVFCAGNAEDGLKLVSEKHPSIVIVDLEIPGLDGLKLLEEILAIDPKTEVVVLAGSYSTDAAVRAIQHGATDYWTKPLSANTLCEKIDGLVAHLRLRPSGEALDEEAFQGIVGRSPALLSLLSRIKSNAPNYRRVLISGAEGTGKELAALAMHRLSPVAGRDLLIIDCAGTTEPLFEPEEHADTPLARTVVEVARGSAIFLDEVSELDLRDQAKLLSILQSLDSQAGEAVGGECDFRVIATTSRNLTELVREKKFREELYDRLAVVQLQVPSLLDRKEDLPLLQAHFVSKHAAASCRPIRGLTRQAERILARHTWPGNIRELENAIAHGCMVSHGDVIDIEDLPAYLRHLADAIVDS